MHHILHLPFQHFLQLVEAVLYSFPPRAGEHALGQFEEAGRFRLRQEIDPCPAINRLKGDIASKWNRTRGTFDTHHFIRLKLDDFGGQFKLAPKETAHIGYSCTYMRWLVGS